MSDLGALAYGRQSMGKDRSIAEQLELGRQRAGCEGWDLLATYSDYISASRFETKARGSWVKLLRDLERPEVGILWLWESSRGDRKLSTWASMLEKCREHKVRIYVETHGRLYDMDNGRDWRTLAEDGVDNAYESEKVSTRTRRSADSRAAEGRPHAGALYGYANLHDPRTGKFTERVIEPSEAANISELFSRIRQGHSLRSIERDWRARDIRTRPPKPCPQECARPHRHVAEGTPGKPFTAAYLRCLAMTAAYTGLRVHLTTGERKAAPYRLDTATEGTWEPVVSREEFFAVREILTDPARRTSRPGRAVHLLSVSPAVRCGVCDGPLCASHRATGASRTRTWMYFCQRSGHVRVLEAELDALAEDAIIAYLSREDNYAAFSEPADSAALERVRGELKTVRDAQADLSNAVTRRGKSPAWALAADDEYERQITALQARERELMTPDSLRGLIEPGPDVAVRWKAAPMSARRQVARIVLAPDRMGVIRVGRTKSGTRVPVVSRVTWDRQQAG